MTNISKEVLPTKQKAELFNQFVNLVTTGDRRDAALLLSCVLTESERIMLIKRMAAIVMLEEGFSGYRIAKTLKLSHTTVDTYHSKLVEGEYDAVKKLVSGKKFDKEKFWKVVEVLLRAGLPPRTGDRWKHVPGMGN